MCHHLYGQPDAVGGEVARGVGVCAGAPQYLGQERLTRRWRGLLKNALGGWSSTIWPVNGGGKVGHVVSLMVDLRLQVRPAAALEQQRPHHGRIQCKAS